MSDIFSLFGGQYESQRNVQAQGYRDQLARQGTSYATERDELHTAGLEEVRRRNESAQKLRERFGFDYSIDQYAALGSAIDSGIIKEDQGWDILAAQTISDNLKRQGINIDALEVYENLPVYAEYVLGRSEGQSARTPKTNMAAIHGAFVLAGSGMRKNILGMQLADARNGNNKELEGIIRERLRQEDDVTEAYGDYQKRNFFVEAAKFAAQSSAYTLFVMAGGMLGGAPGAFMAGWAGATGQSYLGLSEVGVKHEIAYPIAIAMGAVNALIESQLGNAAGLVGRATGAETLQKSITKRAAAFISDKLHLSGAALKMATGPVANYLLEGVGEASEEFFQEIADIVGTELAAFLQKEGVQLDRADYISRIAQAAKGGFMASLFMGLPGLSIDTVGSFGDYASLRTDADTIPSEKVFKDRNKDSPLRGKMSDEEWDKELTKIHQGRQNAREREEARIAAEVNETAGLGEGYAETKTDPETGTSVPLGDLFRKKNGRLYTELDEKYFKSGDARVQSKANLDAHIEYSQDTDGKITIEEYQVRPDRDTPEYRREFFQDFAENFAGHEIAWNPNTEKAVNIREDLVQNNPRGVEAGLSYFAADDLQDMGQARYRNRVIENFKHNFPLLGNAEHAVMAAEWEHFADIRGQSLEEYVNKEFGGLEKAFTSEANRKVDAASKEGKFIKGAVTFEGTASDARAVVYLSRNADLSTFIHEMGHIYRRRLSGDALNEAERIWGVTDGKWTTEQDEQFTEDLERWRREGKSPSPEKQSFFQKFAEFLKKIVNAVSQRSEVSPEIQEFFDKLYTGERAGTAAAANDIQTGAADWEATQSARTAQEAREGTEAGRDTATGVEGATGYDDVEAWVKTLPEKSQQLYRENKALIESHESLERKNPGLQIEDVATDDLEALKAKAREGHDFIRDLANKWAQKWDDKALGRLGFETMAVLKSDERAKEKHNEENTPYNEMFDMVGFTVVVKDLKTLLDMAREVSGDESVVRIKDRYKNPPKSGYQDILLNIKTPKGFVGEIQLNVEQMYEAKEKYGGHTIYEADRGLEKAFKEKKIDQKTRDRDQILLREMSGKFYGKATGLVYAEVQASASSLDIGDPSFQVYTSANSVDDKVLSAFTLNNLEPLLAQAKLRHSTKLREGSSNDGTSTAGLEETAFSTGAVGARTTESSFTSVPSNTNIANTNDSVNGSQGKNSQENEKRIEKARAKWEAADRSAGADDQITLQTGTELKGRYELGEAGISTPSVDPDADFSLSEGFPVNENGTSMNVGRDYTGGFSREAAIRMASDFDQRGMGIIVDSNGVTSSGNNRDISRRIAAWNGTDSKYIAYLKSRPERWGFSREDLAKYTHPTLYFVVDAPAAYTPLYFDQFNRSGKKSVSPVETAIKMSYMVKGDLVQEFSAAMGNYDSINDLYEDTQAATEIFKSLMKRGIITENSYPDYVEAMDIKGKRQERVTSGGKEFLESVMLGAALEEGSIRALAVVPEIRRRIVKGLAPMVDNAALGEYSVIPEINQAVGIAVEVQTNKKKYKSIADYANQRELSLGQRVSTDIEVELAGRLLEKTEYGFADMMGGLNAVLREEARGQSDMFASVSKDDILRRYLGIKARVDGIREANTKTIESDTAATIEKVNAAMDNAGLARGEADGTLFQSAGEQATENQTASVFEDQMVEDAVQHETWREFRDSVETGEVANADNAWYRSLWNDARKIYTTLFQEGEEKTSRPETLDKRFVDEAKSEYLADVLKAIHGILNDRTLEPAEGEDRGEYERLKRLQGRIRRELPGAGSIIGMAAQVNSGRALSSSQYDRLRRSIRQSPRAFRSVFADIMGQDEYLEDLADTADGEPNARLADPRAERTDSMERLREIGRMIGDPALGQEIENGTVTFDDPRIVAFEKGQQAKYERASQSIKALETKIGEDFARLANETKRHMVKLYEDMLAAKERLTAGKDRLNRMVEEGIKIAGPYQKQAYLEQTNYERARKTFDDFAKTWGIQADVREALARRDARAEERTKQQGLNKSRRALAALKEMKRNVIKRITRGISFENVSYDQAIVVKTIQRIFEPSIIEGVNKWIGGAQGPLLREVWSRWSTDEQYREQLMDEAGEGKAGKIAAILGKDWDFITTADKKALIRLLPKTDFVRDLALEELIQENEESIQLDIDERVINGQVHYILGAELEQKVKEAIGEDLYNRVKNKPLGEWSIVEAEELARAVDKLTVEGRRELGVIWEARRIMRQRYREQVLATIKNTGIVINPSDTPEEKARKENEIQRILGKYAAGNKRNRFWNNFFDANLRRFTTAMDGGRKGIFTSLLYWGENDAYNQEQRQTAVRRIAIDRAMQENSISLEELYRTVEIPGLEGTDLYRVSGGKLTVDDLLYILRGYENEETRKAITYGNLSNASERTYYEGRSGIPEEIEAFANKGHGRMMAVVSFAKDFFVRDENRKFLKLAEAIGTDYDRNGERLNKAMIDMFNRPMWRVENYVPMNRREQSGGVNENRVIEDLLGVAGLGQRWVNRGFTEKRITISPYHQAPIELGLYKTWAQSVTDTEHLLAYGPLVQTLNAVFQGYNTAEVKQAMADRWGKAATERISNTIAEFANPNPTRQRNGLDDLIRSLRGKTATAYLAWKLSGVLKQAVTSPWPYLQEIPPQQYLGAALEIAGGFGKANEFIREKSVFMKNRDFDPMLKLVKEQLAKHENRMGHAVDKFNTVGMKGLEWIDWVCVAPGWLAKYRAELVNIAKEQESKYQELLAAYHGSEWSDVLPTEESKVNRALAEIMNDEQQDYEAVARADDAVRRMQPSSRPSDIAPLFKNRSEVLSAVLQFQTALNVIWQNIRYDLPLAIKEKQLMTVVGMVTGYALAGIGLGLLLDDDDGKEKHERNQAAWILYNSLTQFTDAVPVIGEYVSKLTEQVITGKSRYQGVQNLWPVVSKAFGGVSAAAGILTETDPKKREQKFAKAAGNVAEAFGIAFGLPVSGVKELGSLAGIGDGDGDLDLYWQALLGRRNK